MNGATALPCVSTIKPPNTHIMISTGNSQYRLRTRIKRHNSKTIDIGIPLSMRPHFPSAVGAHLLTSLDGSGNCCATAERFWNNKGGKPAIASQDPACYRSKQSTTRA
jgi:hypothetical protein